MGAGRAWLEMVTTSPVALGTQCGFLSGLFCVPRSKRCKETLVSPVVGLSRFLALIFKLDFFSSFSLFLFFLF